MEFDIKKYLKIFAILLFILITSSLFINLFSYFDPLNFCYIKIDNDILRGNQDTIKKAIKLLKKENGESYKTLCRYVDIILEQNCVINMPGQKIDKEGCYIKGSKVIYLKPEKQKTDLIIKKRAEIIEKYSSYSKNFWVNL